jgi:DCN1-like protein 4/5
VASLPVLAAALGDLQALLVAPHRGKPCVSAEPYGRARYAQYAADPRRAFAELYAFCFALAKPECVAGPARGAGRCAC